MITRFPAEALEHWLRGKGKWPAKVGTLEVEFGKYQITVWEVPGVPKPTDAETEAIIDQFLASETTKKADKAAKRAAVLEKLKITESELALLLERRID